jgi:hypothetical protein
MSRQDTTDPAMAIDEHVRAFFIGNHIESLTWDTGPIHQRVLGSVSTPSRPALADVMRGPT